MDVTVVKSQPAKSRLAFYNCNCLNCVKAVECLEIPHFLKYSFNDKGLAGGT
ncbi:hypothetical protein J26TS2_43130 [Shouchella clausii]|nr:hypothetical protein J26TS2_43130 [Shouchella clausii]